MKKKSRKSGTDIIVNKCSKERMNQTEQHIRLRPESIPLLSREMANMQLADIIDVQAVQSIMDDFYKFAHITMALLDLKGNVLFKVGWQDICTKGKFSFNLFSFKRSLWTMIFFGLRQEYMVSMKRNI